MKNLLKICYIVILGFNSTIIPYDEYQLLAYTPYDQNFDTLPFEEPKQYTSLIDFDADYESVTDPLHESPDDTSPTYPSGPSANITKKYSSFSEKQALEIQKKLDGSQLSSFKKRRTLLSPLHHLNLTEEQRDTLFSNYLALRLYIEKKELKKCPIYGCASKQLVLTDLIKHIGSHYKNEMNSQNPHEIFNDIHPIKCCSKQYILNNNTLHSHQKTKKHKNNMASRAR